MRANILYIICGAYAAPAPLQCLSFIEKKDTKETPTCSYVHINVIVRLKARKLTFVTVILNSFQNLFTVQTVRALVIPSQTLLVHSVKGRDLFNNYYFGNTTKL